ncbi:GT2 family glycosyltransferase [Enterovirga rhinocerotis]|uniref:GT2 family glycosyltransferase n=2 Tax=Enterovirga rhinocerotis TaxID=1339210 RepID=A0A4R7BYM5_9HYPH|nr:GT2 family glycosyltransferase [Enterovirga rhinocerotis]
MLRKAVIVARRLWGMRWLLQPGSSARLVARSGLFDAAFYRAEAGLAGRDDAACLSHYMGSGGPGGLRPHPLVDPDFIREQMRGRGGRNPLVAYLRSGWWRGVRPNRHFDPLFYLRTNPDIRLAGFEPLSHYASAGWREARMPSEDFDPEAYRAGHSLAEDEDPLSAALAAERGSHHDEADDEAGRVAPGPVGSADDPPASGEDGADEWAGLAPLPPGEGVPVDIVVPVYGGYAETVTTIRRVLEARNRRACELVVVEDAPPEAAIRAAVDGLVARGLATVLRNEANRGFVASANRGMALHPERDVVLLNADTEVFDGWLDRLAAHAGPRIGTITPLSNAATILSYPVRLRDNCMRLELSDRDLDGLAASLGPASCEVPTGIGFCMYVSRACLAEIGLFDEKAFGRGYGEENDFCRRAAARGWRNIGIGDLVVRHHAGLSFGPEKAARVAEAIAEVERRHPGYRALIDHFIRTDPVAALRQRLDEARIRRAVPDPVLVLGRSERCGADVIRLRPEYGPRFGLYRVEAEAAPVTPNLPSFGPATGEAELGEMLERLGIRRIEVGPDAPGRLSERIVAAARARGWGVSP